MHTCIYIYVYIYSVHDIYIYMYIVFMIYIYIYMYIYMIHILLHIHSEFPWHSTEHRLIVLLPGRDRVLVCPRPGDGVPAASEGRSEELELRSQGPVSRSSWMGLEPF